MAASVGRRLRRKIVERLRQEGRDARSEFKYKATCPYRDEDRHQWSRGWRERDQELKMEGLALKATEAEKLEVEENS